MEIWRATSHDPSRPDPARLAQPRGQVMALGGDDLPCPWCGAATTETDPRCPTCGRRFG